MAPKDKREPRPYRGVNDEIREQTQKMKDMTLKGKLSYFWHYYKVHTFVTVLILCVIINLVVTVVTKKDTAFYGVMLNAYMLDRATMETKFGDYIGIDTETAECLIDTDSSFSYQTMSEFDVATNQQMVALIQSRDLDACVLNDQVFFNYSFNGMMADLREYLSEEDLELHKDRLYYIDLAAIRRAEENPITYEEMMEEAEIRRDATLEDIIAEADTHRDPSTMEEPVPVGIFLEDSPFIQKTNSYPGRVPIFGIAGTTKRPEVCIQYLHFLFDENIPFEEAIAESIF
ncbi:MAG: hypothetical protein IKY23_12755 [Lachnospiraceae bacterium]|nr:hypothetical protein [Lachnospiraceae bacterium]